jgi:hypothetical protein
MTKTELVAALRQSPIWKEDRYGHFQLTFKGTHYRLKIQPLSVRYERKKVGAEWWAKTSDYYKNVEIKDGKLVIHGLKILMEVLPQ